MLFIFSGPNIKIGTDVYSSAPPIFPCPKGTHVLEELLLCLIVLLKYLRETGRGIKYKGKKISEFHILLGLPHLFLFLLQPHL